MKNKLVTLLALLLISACAHRPGSVSIDRSFSSQSHDSRAQFLILHYTVGHFESALQTLTLGGKVSSHYLVSEKPVRIYQLVDENRRAWHAGPSQWKTHSHLNAASIGIEIVNPGPQKTADGLRYAPYPESQIEAVIALCKDIAARHHIAPERILGHSDVQPQTKQDPGPAFPWKRLHTAGLIAWPDPARVERKRAEYAARFADSPPEAAWFQARLAQFGYGLNASQQWDEPTRRVLAAFQMKYRASDYSGHADAETAALLDVVNTPGGMLMASTP